jgi:phosphoserine phosphatase
MTKLILVRHGHVEGITPGRFRGRTDLPLTAQGARQAVATAQHIAAHWRPAIVYTSPLERCVQTGAQIAKACGIELCVLDEFTDIDYGDWRWRLHSEVRAESAALYQRWLEAPHLVRFPRGESLQDLVARTANVLRLALDRHPSDTVVLVGHDSGIRAMLLQLLDQPLCAYWRLSQDPCGISEAHVRSHGAVTLIGVNSRGHLG